MRWTVLALIGCVFGSLQGCGDSGGDGASTVDAGGKLDGAPDAANDAASGGTSAGDAAPDAPPVEAGPDAATGWPGPNNTGVPPGTSLDPYSGPCTITSDGTVIDSKTVTCDLVIQAANVTIKNSKIAGLVFLDTDVAGADAWSYTLMDSEVDAGMQQRAVVSDGNLTVIRCNIQGGETSVHCGEHAKSCTVQDSWLHGQLIPPDASWHLGGFQSNGGSNVLLSHNTIVCDAPANPLGEGCTGDLNLLGDFAPVSYVTADGNFLGANTGSSYCVYAGDAASKPYPNADHVVFSNNVFERGTNGMCGAYGPVSGFNAAGPGNQWSNNTWEDGAPVPPEN
jgi:hypothetical protein